MLRASQSPLRRSLLSVRRFSVASLPEAAASIADSVLSVDEMNVTRHNFAKCLKDLQKDLQLPTCRFVAIDTEFTGLSPNEFEREQYLDTLEERYRKVKRAGESFLITQFGLSTVHLDQKDQFQIKTWNFYVFPRPYGSLDERFLCQASSLQFLSEHGFDFNKFIGDGIPFVNLSKTSVMKKRLQRRIDGLTRVNKNLQLSEDGVAFQKDVNEQLDQWIAGGAKKGEKLLVPTRNSFYSMVVHESVRAKASYLYSEGAEGGVEVSYVSKKIKEELIAAKTKELRQEMDEAIGFSKVIEALSESKLPVVGHNALLDFVYVFHQFYKPLPETLTEFKTQLLELFPTIYDTKHVTLRSPLGEKLKSTGLSSLFEYMRENVKPGPESLIPRDKRFDTYRQALKAEDDGNASLLCHEAGFDAFMTAVCFLGLLAHDAKGELPDQQVPKEGSSARLKVRLEELESVKNQLNLMISDESSLDLGNVAQTIDRARVYRVSSTTKRRIQHVRMEDVFKASKVQRVVRASDQDAFVVLTEPAAAVDDEVKQKLGVDITTYDEHVAAQAEKTRLQKEEADRQLFEKITAARASTSSAEAEGPSMWNRCTIS
jgi:poly(A)-specific ribonuclease